MKRFTPHQADMLRLLADGKPLEKQPPAGGKYTDVDSPEQLLWEGWLIRPKVEGTIGALAEIAWREYHRDGSTGDWRNVIRALADKCPALLEVKL